MEGTRDSDSDKQLSELKVALADAVAENQVKLVELTTLSAAVESLTCEIGVGKVRLLLLLCYG